MIASKAYNNNSSSRSSNDNKNYDVVSRVILRAACRKAMEKIVWSGTITENVELQF